MIFFLTLVDGGWSAWSTWSACTVSCGSGVKLRSRTCSNPAPKYGGKKCPEEENDKSKCTMKPCEGR